MAYFNDDLIASLRESDEALYSLHPECLDAADIVFWQKHSHQATEKLINILTDGDQIIASLEERLEILESVPAAPVVVPPPISSAAWIPVTVSTQARREPPADVRKSKLLTTLRP